MSKTPIDNSTVRNLQYFQYYFSWRRNYMFIALLLLGVLAVLIAVFLMTYTVVAPNEAHIVVFMGGGRRVYSPRPAEGEAKSSSSYFFIPFLMKRTILPLAVVQIEISSFELNDKDMAEFSCNVYAWIRISAPEVAVEKIDLRRDPFDVAVRRLLEAQVAGIARGAAMSDTVIALMKDRTAFSQKVQQEVNGSLSEFGLTLTRLEVVRFTDAPNSRVITNIEKKRDAEIESDSRQAVALQKQLAEVKEAESLRESGKAKEDAEREVELRRIEKERQTNLAAQEAKALVAEKERQTNIKQVEAVRELEVGRAQVLKEATIEKAKGEAEAVKQKGYADAEVVQKQGEAQAESDRRQGIARAEVTKEMGLAKGASIEAEAKGLKEYNDAGYKLEVLKAAKEVEITKSQAMAAALEKADIKINNISGGQDANPMGGILGLLNATGGANLGQMMVALEATSGKQVESLADTAKTVVNDVSQVVQGKKEKKTVENQG
jgi:flotillin